MSEGRTRVLMIAAAVAILAIGVVLGSGPLRAALLGDVGDQIDQLQAEVDQERTARDAAEQSAADAVAYVDGIAPALLAGRLPGSGVLVVSLPGAEGDLAAQLSERIVQAGGEVTGEVSLGDGWSSADDAAFRTALAEQVGGTLVGVDESDPARILAHAFVQGATGGAVPSGTDLTAADAAGADRGPVLWSLLEQAELAGGDAAVRADAVVLIAGSDVAGLAALADAFAEYDAPVVIIGAPGQVEDFAGSREIATVSAQGWTVGSVTAAVAVSEALSGTVPHYAGGDVPEVLGAPVAPAGTSG